MSATTDQQQQQPYAFTYDISPDASVALLTYDPRMPARQRPLRVQEAEARQLMETLTRLFALVDAKRELEADPTRA